MAFFVGTVPATAAVPDGVSGPVIHQAGDWYLRTTPTSGVANFAFRYGTASDLPIVGDWNGDGVDLPVETLPRLTLEIT